MAEVVVAAFEPAHLVDLEPPVFDRRQMQRFAAGYRTSGPAFTLMEGGRALGSGGLVIEDGEGRAWAFLSTALRGRPLLLHRTAKRALRSEEHTSELQSLMRISYAVFCLKK